MFLQTSVVYDPAPHFAIVFTLVLANFVWWYFFIFRIVLPSLREMTWTLMAQSLFMTFAAAIFMFLLGGFASIPPIVGGQTLPVQLLYAVPQTLFTLSTYVSAIFNVYMAFAMVIRLVA